MEVNSITSLIIASAIDVHRELGPGLLESIYEECMIVELTARRLSFERQLPISMVYKGNKLETIYRIDLVVERAVIVELKSVSSLDPVHTAQVLTYLRLTRCHVGLPINFNVPRVKDGIRRLEFNLSEPSAPSAPLR